MRRPKGEDYVNITDSYPKFTESRDGWAHGQRRLALNMGLAMADGEELKLIKVLQRHYPLHLMGPCYNYFILFFKNKEINIHPGNLIGSSRPDYIGVKYRFLRAWAPIPIHYDTENPFERNKYGMKHDAYDTYENLINNKPFELFYGQADLDVARQILGTKKVLC